MENIQELIKQHTDSNIIIEKKQALIEKKQASIEKLQNQIKKIDKKNSWINVIVKPMAKELSSIINLPAWRLLGPSGLDCKILILFAEDKKSLEYLESRKSITFVPVISDNGKFSLSVRDYRINTEKFQKGSLGEINGGNHPLTDISNTPLKEIANKWIH